MSRDIFVCFALCLLQCYTITGSDSLTSSANKYVPAEHLVEVVNRLERLESRNNDLQRDNVQLREEVASLKDYISFLQAKNQEQISNLQGEIVALKTQNQQNKKKLQSILLTESPDILGKATDLTSWINRVTDGNQTFEGVDEPKLKRNDHQTNDKSTIQDLGIDRGMKRLAAQEFRIARAENEVNVAFYAAVGSHHIEHAGANQPIVFDDVITNLGNAYNKFAGDFRAPVEGTYVFSVTLMAYGAHTTHYRITQNGQGKGNIYLRGQDGAYTTSAMTAVLELKQGDNVTIQNVDADEYLYGYAYSTFSGFLLYQIYPNTGVVGK